MERNKQLKCKWEGISEDEKFILGRPNFACAQIAQRLRQMGYEIKQKAEEEQAAVIFIMQQFYSDYGNEWRDKLTEYLKTNP